MEGLLKDVGQTLRSLRRSPGFTFACIAALALGIGDNAAMFSVVNTVLLKPLSFPDADRVVWFSTRADEGTNPTASPAKFQHLRQQTGIVEEVSAARPAVVNYTGGDAVGLYVGMAGIRALLAINTAGLPRVGEDGGLVGLDWRVIAFTVGVSLATGVLFGLVPALRSSRTDLGSTLKESSGRSGTGFRQNTLRSVLVVAEVALALILLVGSALLIRTWGTLQSVDLDLSDAPPSVVINEAMAAQFWPDGDPLADRLLVGRGVMEEFADEPERQIIGIVGDVRDAGLNNDPRPIMYMLQAQQSDAVNAFEASLAPIAWVVRTRTSPAALIPVIEQELTQVAGVPVSGARSMVDVVLASTSRQRFTMWLMTVFGGVALLLAVIGVYGLMAYSVAQRTQEIGIRLALGAEAGRVRSMVVFQGMRLVAVGIMVGVAAAVGLTRVIASLLFGVEALDVTTLVAVAAVLGSASLVAVVVPARRASRVDPVTALRYE